MVDRRRRAGGADAGHPEAGERIADERSDVPDRRQHLPHSHPAHRRGLLLDHFSVRHGALLLDEAEARFDAFQAALLLGDAPPQFGASQLQHAAQLGGAGPLVEDRADLVQGQAEPLERQVPADRVQQPVPRPAAAP